MENEAIKPPEKQHFVDPSKETPDNLHTGDFLSDQRLSFAGTASSFDAHARRGSGKGSNGGAESTLPEIEIVTLTQQKDPAKRQAQIDDTASKLANFISGAHSSLDISIYHFKLNGNAEKTVVDALNKKASEGVPIRLAMFEPPAKHASAAAAPADADLQSAAGPAGVDIPAGLDSRITIKPIVGGGKLMHDKYIVRDKDDDTAAVWTGSTNFTTDAFGDQDNNIITVKNSKDLAGVYETDYQQMWDAGKFAGTGKNLHQDIKVGDSTVTVAFSPGDGAFIEKEIADHIQAAKESVHIASMDISSQAILQALANKIDEGKTVEGIYDGPQMRNAAGAWAKAKEGSPHFEDSQTKIALWNKVKANLVEKKHAPFPAAEFMHDKLVSVDDKWALTGSFNYSTNATHNAENTLGIENAKIATQYREYIQGLEIAYGGMKK